MYMKFQCIYRKGIDCILDTDKFSLCWHHCYYLYGTIDAGLVLCRK